jgi:glycerate dehydrogenase
MNLNSPSPEANHHIVAVEAIHCPIPTFAIPHKRTVHNWTNPSELSTRVKDATIIITTTTRLNADILSPSKTPRLQLIVILASGTDCVDLDAARARDIPVCNCPGTNIDSVSEHAVGLYFALRRKVVGLSGVVRGGDEWKKTGSLKDGMRMADGGAPLLCSQEVVGIVGFGALGARIGVLMRGLGMEVIVAERRGVLEARAGRVLFEEALRRATVLVLCCPRTAETANMISVAEFGIMDRRALLINVARGGIVDEGALVEALRAGEISGAGLDVFANEPVGRGDSALLEGENDGLNLVLSPHLAWFAERTLENLQAGVKRTVEEWFVGNTINRVA